MTSPDAAATRTRTDTVLAAGCGAVALVNYIACLCPTVGPGDSGELTLAALKLGIAHPPGYPLFTWLGRLATLFPGDPARATNLLTALLAAVAVGLAYLAARAAKLTLTGSVVAALSFAFSLTCWTQAESHEVYSFASLLLVVLLLVGLRSEDEPGLLLPASFVLGLAVAHQPTTLLWVPALVVLVWRRNQVVDGSRERGSGVKQLAVLVGLFTLGLSSGLGTLVRAMSRPELNWGDPSTLGRFLAHATSLQYRDLAAGSGRTVLAARAPDLLRLLAGELGMPILLLAGLGVVALLLRRRMLAALLLLAATGIFGLSYDIPDFRVHLLPAFLGLCLLAGAGATWLETLPARRTPTLGAVAAVVLLVVPGIGLFSNFPAARDNRTTLVRDLGENLLLSLPDSAVFFTGSDVSRNAIHYVQVVRRARPDVTVVSTELLFSRAYHGQLGRLLALPGYEEMLRAAGSGPRSERLHRLLLQVVAAAGARPVALGTDLMVPDFFAGPVPRERRVVPTGITNRLLPRSELLVPDAVLARNHELWSAYRLGAVLRDYSQPDYVGIQVLYAASRNNLGMFCLEQGWQEPAREHLTAALALPSPPELRQALEANLRRLGLDSI